jgi:hypothetical protein
MGMTRKQSKVKQDSFDGERNEEPRLIGGNTTIACSMPRLQHLCKCDVQVASNHHISFVTAYAPC